MNLINNLNDLYLVEYLIINETFLFFNLDLVHYLFLNLQNKLMAQIENQKNYILKSVKTLFNLDQVPYELQSSQALQKFVSSKQNNLWLVALPTKQFKILSNLSKLPEDGSLITISKIRTGDAAIQQFFKISTKPVKGFKQLQNTIKNVYEPIIKRKNQAALIQVKQLSAVLQSMNKIKLNGEDDLNFNSFVDEFDFWQDLDLQKSTQRTQQFLKIISPLFKPYRNLGNLSLENLPTLLQTTWQVLSKLYNSEHKYNEKRFSRLIQIFEAQIISKIKLSFPRQADLWSNQDEQKSQTKKKLVISIDLCRKFINSGQKMIKSSKRKVQIRMKNIQQFELKISATFRVKSKVQYLNSLFEKKLISEDPQSLRFLIKMESFLSNHVSVLQTNVKAQKKLDDQKQKSSDIVSMCSSLVENQLQKALQKNSIEALFSVLKKWYYILSDIVANQKIEDYQTTVTRKVTEWLQNSTKDWKKEIDQKKLCSSKLKYLKYAVQRLNQTNLLISNFSQSNSSFSVYDNLYEKTLTHFNSLQSIIMTQFNTNYDQFGSNTKKQQLNQIIGRHVQELSISPKGMKFTVNKKTKQFILEINLISQLGNGYQIKDKIMKWYDQALLYNKENLFLSTLQSRYNTIVSKIQPFQQEILIKQLEDLRKMISHPKIKKNIGQNAYEWSSIQQVNDFCNHLSVALQKLSNYIKIYNQSQSQIEQICIDLLQMQYTTHNFYIIGQKIEQINKIIQTTSAGRSNNDWKQFWKSKVTDVITIIWQKALISGVQINMTLTPILQNKKIIFQPSLSETKQKYYKEVKSYVGWPLQNKFLNGEKMINQSFELVTRTYTQLQEKFQKINWSLRRFFPLTDAISIDIDQLQEKLNKKGDFDAEQLLPYLRSLQKSSQLLNSFQKQYMIQNFEIDISNLKYMFKVDIDEQIDNLMQIIKYSIKTQSQQVQEFISNVMAKLQNKPKNMNEMTEAIKQFEDIRQKQKQIQDKIKKIQAKNKHIKGLVGQSLNTGNMLKRWDNFQIASVQMNNILEDQKSRLHEECLKKGQNLQNQSQKCYKRFKKIKPETQQLSREDTIDMFNKIKDWQVQWSDIQKNFATIKADLQSFKIKMPAFSVYKQTKKKLQKQMGNWLFFIEYRNQIQKFFDQEWVIFRVSLNKYGDIVNQYIQKSKQIQAMDSVSKFLKQLLQDDKQGLNLLRCITGQNFEKQHWGILFSLLGIKHVTSIDKLLFKDLIEANLLQKANQIRQLQSQARGELTIRKALDELQAWGVTREFQLSEYNSMGRNTPLIKQWKDMMTQVSDNMAMVLSIRQSKYAKRFKSQIQNYEKKFGILDAALLKLNQIQRKWIYLEPIFMRGALPQEQGRWRSLDEDYRNIMQNISRDPHIIQVSSVAGFIETLTTIMSQLQRCQKALNDFLEQKRNKFPRFYFLGDDDMLEILGQSQNPLIIQLHLKKLFSGIHTVKFTDTKDKILSMMSHLKQQVRLNEDIEVTQTVEDWLQCLNKKMVQTLKISLKNIKNIAIQDTFQKYPCQIICLVNQINFNAKCSTAISNGSSALTDLKNENQRMLSILTKKCHQIKNQLILSKIKSLILDIIHHISILDILINSHIKQTNDWLWYKQLTFKSSNNENVEINMANSNFEYTFEYQGNSAKLVYTPLTDKCYLTLTQAMSMGLGGNPYGPAGTGKTQSVKALALAFGRQVLVFNCDQGLDFMAMGRIFIGLVKCGAWGCFDQFNRLLQQQLSAISQQIQIIQEAIKAKQKHIHLLGKDVNVNFNSGIFVTLNPAGKGYGGRSKLPDNLKQLFRPIAMSVPDNELIAQVLLFSEGFTTAKVLSQKIITIFTLSKQLLSKQLHYDWGLRALKTILTVAGRLVFEQSGQVDESIQSQILIKALRINTISKLTFSDMLKFNILVQDVFPGINIKDIIYQRIQSSVKEVFREQNFQILPNQLNKILQFYEATKQRIGAVLVGPSGCGKTTIWKALKSAYEKLNQTVKVHLINPKAMPRSQFLGCMNNDTREFSQGVLTISARQVIKQSQNVINWIICDGDVDPEWIQALNSVLDDNHLLTLPTGQRISFGSNVNFIFQTDNLQFASPATISRMGMIFMNDQDININSIIKKWSKGLTQQKSFILNKIQQIEQICTEIQEKYQSRAIVPTTKVGIVRSAISLLQISNSQTQFQLNLVKGLASNFDMQIRSQIFQKVYGKKAPGQRDPLSLREKDGKIGQYKDDNQKGLKRIYLTKQIKKDIEIVTTWLKNNENIIIVGKQGCGKSILLEAAINELQKTDKCKLITLHCNRQTKSAQLIKKLYQTCQKVTTANGKTLRPLNCSKQIFILKQINLSKPDKYQTIELITFLQSLITHEGFYDQNLEFIRIGEGIRFVCTIKPSSTIGRYEITTRFVSNLRVLKVDYNSVGTKQKLESLTEHSQKIQGILQQIWEMINQNFKPDDQAHYLFTPRDLNSIINCLENYEINLNNINELTQALFYEVMRQFGDKLVSASQKQKLVEFLKKIFGVELSTYYYLCKESKKLKPLHKSQYESTIINYIKEYEKQVKKVDVVLVSQVIDLMATLQKKIIERGSMLLAGSSGSFRKSAAKVICHSHGVLLKTLSNNRNPSLKQFYKDLKSIFEIAGGKNQQIMFYLEQHQLRKSQFYQKINSLISSGQIQGLFTIDEIQSIVQDKQNLINEYYGKNLYESFMQRIKKNVLIVLSLDHRNKQFYQVCSANPAFYSSTRVVWLNCYQKQSLARICHQKIKHLNLVDEKQIIKGIVKIHQGSSQKYIDLLRNFVLVYNKIQSKSGNKLGKLKMGLKKLSQTAKFVNNLTAQALSKKRLLTEKQRQAEESLNYITEAMQQASMNKAEAQKLKAFLEVEEKKIQKDRYIVMSQLDKVRPLIEEAKTAVSGLTPKNIQQIRAFMNPPEAVKHVLKAVLSLFGNKNDTWNQMKNFLKICKDQILLFDIKSISQKTRKQVQAIIMEYAYSFQRQNVFKASQDAVPLADWVKAAVQYSKTYQKVRPLEQNLNKIQKELSHSRIRLTECIKKQKQSSQRVHQLNQNFVLKTNEASVLQSDLAQAQKSLASGQQLLEKLKDQKVRWQKDSDKLQVQVQMMPKNALLTACFVTYLAESAQNIRVQKIGEWKKILQTHYFNFLTFVTNQAAILEQVVKGLPNDQLSIENSQIVGFSNSISLIVDPHTQATAWLKQNLKQFGTVETLTQQDSKFMNSLQLAVRFGKILVIQQIDYIEPVLMSIIKKDYVKQGSRNIMQLGQKLIDVSDTFKLYLATRNSSISIPYNQKDHLCFVNFSVTRSGLQSKLLSLIITHFQPQIEKQKQQLLEQQQKLKIELVDLQQKLLKELADSTGNILQNKALIDSLNNTKQKSQIVSKSLKRSSVLQQQLDQKREVFRPISDLGSKIYLAIGILNQLSNMYRYSLSQFIVLFNEALDMSNYIQKVKQFLIEIVFNNVAIGLMKNHRLLLALIFAKEINQVLINKQQFDFLLGNVILDQSSQVSVPKYLDSKQGEFFRTFIKICQIRQNFDTNQWSEWFHQYDAEQKFPQNSLTQFQRCLLIKVCRPDRLMNSLNNFTVNVLKVNNLSGLNVNLKTLVDQKMKPQIPALFIVSVGFDPSKQLQQYANSTVGKDNFQELSMGGDQNDFAIELVRDGAKTGKWVCLKNLHLVISFASVLEKQLLKLQYNPNFRLFLTTQSHAKFPSILLQQSYKISYEAPPGLKQNFSRLLESSSNVSSSQVSNPLENILTYFHSVIQERRNYNPQGWIKLYEFSYGDYKAGMQVIKCSQQKHDTNWKLLYGLMLDTVYGGRIDNEVDMRLLDIYLREYFNPDIQNGKKPIYSNVPIQNLPKILEALPNIDNPELYSLPLGIDKTILRIKSKQFVQNLKILTLSSTQDLKFNRDVWTKLLETFFSLWKSLVQSVGKLDPVTSNQMKSIDPIESFVYGEYSQALQNFDSIRKGLKKLYGVLYGNQILTTEIQQIGKYLVKGETYPKWRNIWEGPDLLIEWTTIFTKKLNNMKKWRQLAQNKRLLSQQLDLSEVYRPQIFFNALKQKTGRQKKIPINKLKVKCSFEKPNTEIYVKLKALILQGASHERNTLINASHDKEFENIQIFYVFYNEQENQQNDFLIPFYTDIGRSSLLAQLPIQSDGKNNKKILASAALTLGE